MGECDDDNNRKSCNYDDGDCCGPDIGKSYCKQCQCLDPNYKPPTTPAPKCGNVDWKGDGNCDDVNNNGGCEYDGGDCCATTVKGGIVERKFCSTCACLDPNAPKPCEGTCGGADYVGTDTVMITTTTAVVNTMAATVAQGV